MRRPPLPPGPYLVVGLARSGIAAGIALRARGETVAGCDSAAVPGPARAALEAAGATVHERTAGVELLDGAAALVKSPGVPAEAAVVRAARERGIPVLGELELGWRLLENDVIAVTGSNGKTTTTELIGAIHRAAGVPVAVAGNVGTALTSLVALGGGADAGATGPETGAGVAGGGLDPRAVIACEASSFQLEDTLAFAPDAAVLLNVAPDHLDRHGTFAAYREAKLRVFANQPAGAIAVLPAGFGPVQGTATRVTFASPMTGAAGPLCDAEAPGADLIAADGRLVWRGEPVVDLGSIRLRGAHNLENAMAAAAVTLARGIPAAAVAAGLAEFAGVEHRLEEVGRFGGVLYVDDSKATNVASAVVGIRSFPGGVHVILGGRGKQEDYAPLARAVAERGRAAYLVGEEAARIRDAIAATGVPVHDCGDLEHAVAAARASAAPGDVILLSPACASYDQYSSFGERGDHFKALARAAG